MANARKNAAQVFQVELKDVMYYPHYLCANGNLVSSQFEEIVIYDQQAGEVLRKLEHAVLTAEFIKQKCFRLHTISEIKVEFVTFQHTTPAIIYKWSEKKWSPERQQINIYNSDFTEVLFKIQDDLEKIYVLSPTQFLAIDHLSNLVIYRKIFTGEFERYNLYDQFRFTKFKDLINLSSNRYAILSNDSTRSNIFIFELEGNRLIKHTTFFPVKTQPKTVSMFRSLEKNHIRKIVKINEIEFATLHSVTTGKNYCAINIWKNGISLDDFQNQLPLKIIHLPKLFKNMLLLTDCITLVVFDSCDNNKSICLVHLPTGKQQLIEINRLYNDRYYCEEIIRVINIAENEFIINIDSRSIGVSLLPTKELNHACFDSTGVSGTNFTDIDEQEKLAKIRAKMQLEKSDWRDPLIVAASKGQIKLVQELIKRINGLIYKTDEDKKRGIDALKHAAYNGHWNIVLWLLEHNISIDPKEYEDAFFSAVAHNKCDVVKAFLDRGMDINVVESSFSTKNKHRAIHHAAKRKKWHMVEFLALQGANFDDETDHEPLLIAAARHGAIGAVSALLAKGFDINRTTRRMCSGLDRHDTALRVAVNCHQWQIVQLLLGHKAQLDVNVTPDDKNYIYTAELILAQAVVDKLCEPIYWLHASGVKIASLGNSRKCLLRAIEIGHIDIIKALASQGVSILIKNDSKLGSNSKSGLKVSYNDHLFTIRR